MTHEAESSPLSPHTVNWERHVIEELIHSAIKEQRIARRWRIFFRSVYLGLFALFIFWVMQPVSAPQYSEPHVAQINIDGVISAESLTANADGVMDMLGEAYANPNTKAVILRINSPGGSAVESSRIFNEVTRLRKLHPKIKVYAVVDEMAASGGYFIAASADEIYANPASLVGSIGVLIDGFGFVEVMKKLGVERRLIIAGTHKGIMDPFSPLTAEDEAYAHNLINTVHDQFIAAVKEGRGKRLDLQNPDIFSGLVWTGEQALDLGLIDGFGDAATVAREVIKIEDIVLYTPPVNLLDLFAMRLGVTFSEQLTSPAGVRY